MCHSLFQNNFNADSTKPDEQKIESQQTKQRQEFKQMMQMMSTLFVLASPSSGTQINNNALHQGSKAYLVPHFGSSV